jgi:hypothetical protein
MHIFFIFFCGKLFFPCRKLKKEDHPLNSALEFIQHHKEAHLFSKELYPSSPGAGSPRNYMTQDAAGFFADFVKMDPKDRVFGIIDEKLTPLYSYYYTL